MTTRTAMVAIKIPGHVDELISVPMSTQCHEVVNMYKNIAKVKCAASLVFLMLQNMLYTE